MFKLTLRSFAIFLAFTHVATAASPRPPAESIESFFLRRLARATTPAQVEQAKQSLDEIKTARLACQIQLDSRTIPSACFLLLNKETQLGLRSTKDSQRRTKDLEARCEAAASSLAVQDVPTENLHGRCLNQVLTAKAILAYRDDHYDPESGQAGPTLELH